MGADCSRPCPRCSRSRRTSDGKRNTLVTLHVYDSADSQDNNHCGVEVYGWEWSYRAALNSASPASGVFSCWPRACEGFSYRESIPMGGTSMSEDELLSLVGLLEKKWPGADPSPRKSADFCDELCRMLGVDSVPAWVKNCQEGSLANLRDLQTKDAKPIVILDGGKDNAQIPVAVMLHVYNIGTSGTCRAINGALRPLGMGLYHCGIEVYDWEWSYSDTSLLANPSVSGVFCCRPRYCEGHTYHGTVDLGMTSTSEREVLKLVTLLEKKWPGNEYDVLQHNCGHFCNELCRMLGVAKVPEWVTGLAKTGQHMVAKAQKSCCVPLCCWSEGGGRGMTTNEVDFVRAVPAIEQSDYSSN